MLKKSTNKVSLLSVFPVIHCAPYGLRLFFINKTYQVRRYLSEHISFLVLLLYNGYILYQITLYLRGVIITLFFKVRMCG